MDPRYYCGDDDRDELQADITRCPDCGALDDADCDPDCQCEYCQRVGAALAASREVA